jgi:transcription-repair coupling factor (superfamily II helicase)
MRPGRRPWPGRRVLQFHPLPQATGPGVIDAGGRIGRNFAPERQQENISLFGALADHVRSAARKRPVVVASYSEGARERLKGLIEDEGLAEPPPDRRFRAIGKGGRCTWRSGRWNTGSRADGLTVISEQDVLGDRLIRAPKKARGPRTS